MSGEEIRLGPFREGLNTYSDPTAIGDTSLAEVINFEMDEDGALTNRPPFESMNLNLWPSPATAFTKILGYYSSPGGGAPVLIATNGASTYWLNGSTWTHIINRSATAIVQYRDDLWLITAPGDTRKGGKWTPSGGFVEDANIPQGQAIISHKDRLWVASGKTSTSNGSRLYMSTIVLGAVNWPATPVVINVGAGDGQNIVDLAVYNSDIVIFKEASTYRFSYITDPAAGTLSRISATIGIADTQCYAEHENSIYLLFRDKVYMFINYNFEELNSKVPLVAKSPSANLGQAYSLSIWADRLIVQYYDQMYVYRLKTRTWSVWSSANAALKYIGRLWPTFTQGTAPSAYLMSSENGRPSLFRVTDGITSVREEMTCSITTKNYDFDSSSRFKRLFYWGVDTIANVTLTLEVKPINYGRQATWGEVKTRTWGQAKAGGFTWGQPITPSFSVIETVPVGGLSFGRKFVKSIQSLRFRQVAFKVSGKTFGDFTTAPLKIFSLATFVSDKQPVSRKIS